VTGFVDLTTQCAAFFRRHPALFPGILIGIVGLIAATIAKSVVPPAVLFIATTFVRHTSIIALLAALNGDPLELEDAGQFPFERTGHGVRHTQHEQERYTDFFEPDIHNYSFAIPEACPGIDIEIDFAYPFKLC
jgi:hypothetical protein